MTEILPLNELSRYLKRLSEGQLWLRVIFALAAGAITGVLINPSLGLVPESMAGSLASWLDLPGNIFLRLVQMVMIPLVFASIISGIVSNVNGQLRTMGLSLSIYFVATTVISIGIGIALALLLKPGQLAAELGTFSSSGAVPAVDSSGMANFTSIPEAISNLIPSNPVESILYGEMLGVVIFTIIIGVAITQLPAENRSPIARIIEAVQKICMIVISWAMMLVPYAVFGMMAALIIRVGPEALYGLGYYLLVVIGGLFALFLVYLLILAIVARKNPFVFLGAIREPQLLAFSTASSAAVMPLSMKVADEELQVSSRISDFVIPIGASINMDGTALFQCVTAIFISQAYGIDLSIPDLLLITVTLVGASIGTPAIPGGGVIILASVLSSVGIPTEGVVIIIGIDRILGMFRTTVNVTGDLVACVVFNRWFGGKPVEETP